MISSVRAYIVKHRLLQPEDKVIVGVSGGADSIALLHVLVRAGYACTVAHCNFHLRGAESDRDEHFVAQVAASLHLPFYKTDFDTAGYAAREHMSIEMAARVLRYRQFEEWRSTLQAQAIAVAHHRDDSVETVLLNLIRGTGIRGLCGIRPKNGYLIRPFLSLSRREILEWLSRQQLVYQTDSSNSSDEYTRNFIRLRLLPLMEELNPSVREAVTRTARHLSGIESLYADWIEKERKRIMPDAERIDIRELMKSPAPQTVLYELVRSHGFTRALSESVFESLQGEPGKTFSAPDASCRIVKDRDFLLLAPCPASDERVYAIGAEDTLTHPVRLSTQKKAVDARFEIEKKASVASFDFDKLAFPLTLRTWREGDWFIPFGMRGRKKLSDYFTDRKFSLVRKERMRVLCSREDIIWVVGERVDNRFRIDSSTKFALIVNFFDDNFS
ncbi:MAG: tRNA lysidine(34) synthetase TilS [Tannerella sp.]|jgi:tRNA(Ile)-lysidine synthase|nr:tRNA lysidine(34) synthetase TilS [Tannerella sp.]